jgi:hypothetical protein
MSSKPKPPKPKPINQQRIAEVRTTLQQQNQAIESQLTTYATQQMGNLDSLYQQKASALDASKQDAERNRLLLQANRQSLIGYLQQQRQQKTQVNQTAAQQRQLQLQQQQTRQIKADNKVKPQARTMGI